MIKFYIPWLIILFFGFGGLTSEDIFGIVFGLLGVIFGTLLLYFFHRPSDKERISSTVVEPVQDRPAVVVPPGETHEGEIVLPRGSSPQPARVTPPPAQETKLRPSPAVEPAQDRPVVVVPPGETHGGEIILPRGSSPQPARVTPPPAQETQIEGQFDFPDASTGLQDKILETIEVQAYLDKILGTSEDEDVITIGNNGQTPSPNSKHEAEIQQARQSLPFTDDELQSLDPQFIPILAETLREREMSEKDFRGLCKKFGCSMHRGVLDEINTWAIDRSGDPILLEKDKDISVNPECSLIPEG